MVARRGGSFNDCCGCSMVNGSMVSLAVEVDYLCTGSAKCILPEYGDLQQVIHFCNLQCHICISYTTALWCIWILLALGCFAPSGIMRLKSISLVPRPTSGRHFIASREGGSGTYATKPWIRICRSADQSKCAFENMNEVVTCGHEASEQRCNFP